MEGAAVEAVANRPGRSRRSSAATKKKRRGRARRPATREERVKAWRGILTTLALLAVLFVGPGAWAAIGAVRDHGVAQDLTAHGTTVQVHDVQVKVAPTGYHDNGVDKYRVRVDIGGTVHEAKLVAAHADTSHLPTRHWIAAPKPYSGTLDVVVDPAHPDRAMTKADIAWELAWAPLRSLLLYIGIAVAAILGLGALFAVNSGLIGKRRRGGRPRRADGEGRRADGEGRRASRGGRGDPADEVIQLK